MSASSSSRSKSGYYKALVGVHKFIVDKRYQQLKPIGDGSYGLVASAIDTITGEIGRKRVLTLIFIDAVHFSQPVAIKKIRDTFMDVVDAKRILRELKLLRHFNSHENIITILDIMVYPLNTPAFDDIYIVTNLYESDLEKIIKSKQALTDRHFQFFLYQLLRGLKYVHSANVLHRDLKPSNILVNGNCDLAVCDFGLARGYNSEADDTLTTYVVTRWYRSPEVLCNSGAYGKGLDIWSAGCIFAELLTHYPFFRGDNPQHQLAEIIKKVGCPNQPSKLSFVHSPAALNQLMHYGNRLRPPFHSFFPEGTAPLAIDLLERMLQFNPDDRITVDEALNHVYLRDFTNALSATECPQVFDFEFEKLVQGDGAEVKETVRYLMYEEMRLYRPSAPIVSPPWLMSPTTRQRSFNSAREMESDGKRLRLGATPRRIADAIAIASSSSSSSSHRDKDSKEITPRSDLMDVSDDEVYSDAMLTARSDETPVANTGGSFFGGEARDSLSADEKFYDAHSHMSALSQYHTSSYKHSSSEKFSK